MRQAPILRDFDPPRGVSVATLAYEYQAGHQVPEHAHGSDQLIYAMSGVMEVTSGANMWLTPPSFAIWIPAGTSHRIYMPAAVSMRTLYFRPGLLRTPPLASAVLHVTPLLRELILETVRVGRLRTRQHHEQALRDLLVLHLESASSVPTFVPLPADLRALAVAQSVLSAPGLARPLAALCRDAGLSVRTLQRLFLKQLGIDFETWRRQVRLTRAVELLLAGSSVKQAASDIGYRQASAFVESFRKSFGMTPRAWAGSLQSRTVPASKRASGTRP